MKPAPIEIPREVVDALALALSRVIVAAVTAAVSTAPREQQAAPVSGHDRVLRYPAVVDRIGLTRTTIWRMVQDKRFPAPIRLGRNSVGWRASDVETWLTKRPSKPDTTDLWKGRAK